MLCLDPDFDLFDFLVGDLSSEDKRDPVVYQRVNAALESNPIFANCLNTGTTFEDKTRYINYAFEYVNEEG